MFLLENVLPCSEVISIGFIGDFLYYPPEKSAIVAVRIFMDYLVEKGVLAEDYELYGHCQLDPIYDLSPGAAFFDILSTWPHFVASNLVKLPDTK